MKAKSIPNGTITSPLGFLAGAAYAGLKTAGDGVLDLGILYSEVSCTAAGIFTTNKVKAAPVLLSQKHLERQKAQAVVVNSGCANACTGEEGLEDAAQMACLTADKLRALPDDVLVGSTGVIGVRLPMEKIRLGLEQIALSHNGGHELARAIVTTDTFTKEIALRMEISGKEITIGGVAKGAGMIHPNMATLLCFLTSDAVVDASCLHMALQRAVDVSFNMISIDGDTSTNDTAIILANGVAGNEAIREGTPEAQVFQAGLQEVCTYLAKCIARDGEGATRLIEVTVEGAQSPADARIAARTVAGSTLLKAAVHGSDPNWGRIVAAVGRSGAEVVASKLDIFLDSLCLMKAGRPQPFDTEEAQALLSKKEVPIKVNLNLGKGEATAWGCDLSEEYVTLNSAYTT
ncbi:MAG: bifunctional ornithine acetyltransferase/N-acetylglutamate synthase [Chloroflexi bacterium RBG_13_54_9]|nr:MAG: bifunctional ornithine acetyltransferase/N-acetylglutamate synthase [Chloroflexi bacterium RBG_13_54_9]